MAVGSVEVPRGHCATKQETEQEPISRHRGREAVGPTAAARPCRVYRQWRDTTLVPPTDFAVSATGYPCCLGGCSG